MQTTTNTAQHIALAVSLAAALVLGLLLAGGVPSRADDVPIHSEELTAGSRGTFTDGVSVQIRRKLDGRGTDVLNLTEASHVANLRLTLQPGAQFPWHTHPGPVIVTVTAGRLVYVQADDCVPREYPAGTSFVDPGNSVHTAYTPTGADETVLIATVLDVPATGPLMTPADGQDELDERCGIDVATPDDG